MSSVFVHKFSMGDSKILGGAFPNRIERIESGEKVGFRLHTPEGSLEIWEDDWEKGREGMVDSPHFFYVLRGKGRDGDIFYLEVTRVKRFNQH